MRSQLAQQVVPGSLTQLLATEADHNTRNTRRRRRRRVTPMRRKT